MALHCSRAGFSPEIDGPAERHADHGVSADCAIAWLWNILDVAQLLASSIQVDED